MDLNYLSNNLEGKFYQNYNLNKLESMQLFINTNHLSAVADKLFECV